MHTNLYPQVCYRSSAPISAYKGHKQCVGTACPVPHLQGQQDIVAVEVPVYDGHGQGV